MIKLKSLLEQSYDWGSDDNQKTAVVTTDPKYRTTDMAANSSLINPIPNEFVNLSKKYDAVISELSSVIDNSPPAWLIKSTQIKPIGFLLSISDFLKKNPSVNDNLAKVLIALIFAESKNSYGSYLLPKEWGGWIDNTFFGGNRSQGVAQIKPDTLKQYGFDPEKVDVFDHRSTLEVLYKMIRDNKAKSELLYNGSTITHYDKDDKLITSPAIAGNAALHAAIVAYNSGAEIIESPWCETDQPGIGNHCDITSREPMPKDRPGFVAKTYQDRKIPNYIPYKNIYGKKINAIYSMKSLDPFLSVIRKLS